MYFCCITSLIFIICYECRFIDISKNVSIKEANRQNRDIQFVCELLQTRQDLAEKYFREKYLAMENYRQLTMEFNVDISVESINVMEGTSDISRPQEKSVTSINEKTTVLSVTPTSSPKKQKTFRHKFTFPQIELLVACINEISLFESKVSIAEPTSAGRIPFYRPQGKLVYFERTELEIWLRQNPVKTREQIVLEVNSM